MAPALLELALRVPAAHADCAAWLRALAPEVLGPVLEVARTVGQLPRGDDPNLAQLHAQEVARLKRAHADDLQAALADLRPAVQAEFEARAGAKLEAAQHAHAAKTDALEAALGAAQAERDQLRAAAADLEAGVQAKYEGQLAHLRALLGEVQAKADVSTKLVVEEVRAAYEQHLAHMRLQLETREREHRAKETEVYGKVEALVASFGGGGNSAAKGRAGEHLVQAVHERLQLGTLEDCTHVKAAGFADYTWEWTPPDGPRIACLVEIKNARDGDKARDLNKFALDVHEGAQAGRINAAMYVSLVDRVAGKPRVSLDLVHGVPTLWACRQPDDDVSAAALVELAFVTFAGCWPLLAQAEGGEGAAHATLQRVASCLKTQVAEFQRLQPRIDSLERAADSIRREVTHLRRIREDLMQGARALQVQLPDAEPDAEDEVDLAALAAQLEAAVRAYRAAHNNRYPKEVADLKALLPHDALRRATGEAFHAAAQRVRSETYSKANKNKRKKAEEGE